MNQITGLNSSSPLTEALSAKAPTKPDGGFKNLFLDSINQVNQMQQEADKAVESLMTGGDANPAKVLTAIQKADMSFRMLQQIRNKVVQAYQEIKEIRI